MLSEWLEVIKFDLFYSQQELPLLHFQPALDYTLDVVSRFFKCRKLLIRPNHWIHQHCKGYRVSLSPPPVPDQNVVSEQKSDRFADRSILVRYLKWCKFDLVSNLEPLASDWITDFLCVLTKNATPFRRFSPVFWDFCAEHISTKYVHENAWI